MRTSSPLSVHNYKGLVISANFSLPTRMGYISNITLGVVLVIVLVQFSSAARPTKGPPTPTPSTKPAFKSRKVCKPPRRPRYGSFIPVKNYYYIGQGVFFRCKKGYKLVGKKYARCIGRPYQKPYWSNRSPICKRKCMRQCY